MIKSLYRFMSVIVGLCTLLLISTPAVAHVSLQETPEPPPVVESITTDSHIYMPLVSNSPPVITPPGPPTGPTIIDHNSIALFERIPERYITAARSLRVLFADRSVGMNIHEALYCLEAPNWSSSASSCRRDYYNTQWDWKTFTQTDLSSGAVPPRIQFTPGSRFSRSNWTFDEAAGSWSEIVGIFINTLGPRYLSSKDVLSFQFSYLNVADNDDIASTTNGFFVRRPTVANRNDIGDLEAFWARNPNKRFFLWTTSLSRSIGTQVSTDFNNQMRQYGIQHNMFVLDVAAIESYTDTGRPCYDNRDGVPFCATSGECENYPNDNRNYPAICQDYTTEKDGGHLGSVSAGRIRIVKAFWVLMARMAGWDGRSQ